MLGIFISICRDKYNETKEVSGCTFGAVTLLGHYMKYLMVHGIAWYWLAQSDIMTRFKVVAGVTTGHNLPHVRYGHVRDANFDAPIAGNPKYATCPPLVFLRRRPL